MHQKLNEDGYTLLESAVTLALSAILFLVLDKVMATLWLTRKNIEHAQENYHLRTIPVQLFSDILYHAGNLGCRATHDGITVKAPTTIPNDFFIHQRQAVKIKNHELLIHETMRDKMFIHHSISEGEILKPEGFQEKSDWILVTDCEAAELVPFAGKVTQNYQPPIYLTPVVISSWKLKNNTLSGQQIYPPQGSQPIVTPVENWEWTCLGELIELRWEIDGQWVRYLFEMGNSTCSSVL